jgi:hypothetical protein
MSVSPPRVLSVSPPRISPLVQAHTPASSSGPKTPGSTPRAPTGHVHVRSHSLTPRLSSKLGGAKPAAVAPPMPSRPVAPPMSSRPTASSTASSGSERERLRQGEKARDRKRTASSDKMSSVGSGAATRPGFPWAGAGSTPASSPGAGPSSPRLQPAPPVIVETAPAGEIGKARRTSQIVHQSGFLNRLATFVPPPLENPDLWVYAAPTPAPALTKGWKPLKAVLKGSKLYFFKPPNDRVAGVKALFPEGIEPDAEAPEEAPPQTPSTPDPSGKPDGRRTRAHWGRTTHPGLVFSESSPRRILRGAFEALVHEAVVGSTFRTTDDPERPLPSEAQEQEWQAFAGAVITCLPVVDRARFETEFARCARILVDGAPDGSREYDRQMLAWAGRYYLSSHGEPADMAAWEAWRDELLPGVKLEAPAAAAARELKSTNSELDRDTAERVRRSIAVDYFTQFDQRTVARTLSFFHQTKAAALPDAPALDFCLKGWSLDDGDGELPFARGLNMFSGRDDRPHWLSMFILLQLLVSESHSSNYPQHLPARVAYWATIGEACRRAGDVCSWRAVAEALCAPPLARMIKLWRRVPPETYRVVHSWVHEHGRAAPAASQTSLWFADAPDRLHDEIELVRTEDPASLPVGGMLRAGQAFGEIKQEFARWARPADIPESNDLTFQTLLKLWRAVAIVGPSLTYRSGIVRCVPEPPCYVRPMTPLTAPSTSCLTPLSWSRAGAGCTSHSSGRTLPPRAYRTRSSRCRSRKRSRPSPSSTGTTCWYRRLRPSGRA